MSQAGLPRGFWSTLLLGALLAGSLAFNAHLMLARRGDGSSRTLAEARPSRLRAEAPPAGACTRCQQRLARCMAGGPGGAMPIFGAGAAGGPGPAPRDSGKGLESLLEVDAELQQSVLCEVARRHLLQHWTDRRDAITEDLRRSVNDAPRMRQDLLREAREMSAAMGLSDQQSRQFSEQFAPLRDGAIATVAGLLERRPVPYADIHRQVQRLFAGEDRLAGQLFGDQARRQLRSSQAESRITVLAILAALADLSWDDALSW